MKDPQPLDRAGRAALADVALGRQAPDLVLRNGRVVNVFTGQIESADVAISAGRIAALGRYRAEHELDLAGCYVTPGFIDGHVHLESAHLVPSEFARAVVPRGTVAVVADPHELANVGGVDALRWFIRDAAATPLRVHTMVPSCVPASPFETPGAVLGPQMVAGLRREPGVSGLAEVMNVPGVLAGDPELLAKLAAFDGGLIDGHAPGLSGAQLCAYLDHDIRSDHESTTAAEVREKVGRGMYIGLRQGSSARNLRDLLPAVDDRTARRCFLVTDDRSPADLADLGHLDDCLRICVAEGMDPVRAVTLATLNPAEYLGARDRGAIAPGYVADLVVLTDLREFRATAVLIDGCEVARDGAPLWACAPVPPPAALLGSMHLAPVTADRFAVPVSGAFVRVIEATPGQLRTGSSVVPAPVRDGQVIADPAAGLAKLAVLERHHGGGGGGLGLVRGLGLRRGALASTMAHDAHHLIVCGVDDRDMAAAVNFLIGCGGGFAVAAGETVIAALPLPVAGLLSPQPFADVAGQQRMVRRALCGLVDGDHDPFDTLQFLALTVIPTLKLSDRGLVDVDRWRHVDLFVAQPQADCQRPAG